MGANRARFPHLSMEKSMADKNLIKSPVEPIATPPAGFKGSGGGTYDGIEGQKRRTPTPDGPPEKVFDDVGPLPKAPERFP